MGIIRNDRASTSHSRTASGPGAVTVGNCPGLIDQAPFLEIKYQRLPASSRTSRLVVFGGR